MVSRKWSIAALGLASSHESFREIVVGIRISRVQFKSTSGSANGLVCLRALAK
jgi:hypothetical protein